MKFLLVLFRSFKIGWFCLFLSDEYHVVSQKVIGYGPDELTARVHYNQFLYKIYEHSYANEPRYPVKGVYSPTMYNSNLAPLHRGTGVCNYICIPTNDLLDPGQQYRLTVVVKLGRAYSRMPYFQSHLGIALTSDLFDNYFGLWPRHYAPLGLSRVEDPDTVQIVFRPLCRSSFVVMGVFQGLTMDQQECFACPYSFELHDLLIEKHDDPKSECIYLCDAFMEERLQRTFSSGSDTDTLYFEPGSANVHPRYKNLLDSIPSKLRTGQDIVTLYAYTDKSGDNNDSLGAARNANVYKELVSRGIDSSRICRVNYGESKALAFHSPVDRRVEIDVNRGKVFQRYYTEALQAADLGDYGKAKSHIGRWARLVPPEYAIYALFDCWGEGEKANWFRQDLLKYIRTRSYAHGRELKFRFDSLYCEDQKDRTLTMSLALNRLPDFSHPCVPVSDTNRLRQQGHFIDHLYERYHFPSVEQVGERGNTVLPSMILHIEDTVFQKKYLPLVRKACEEEIISWTYYAMLYDKINIVRNGHQRYGTQWRIDAQGVLNGMYPFEDETMVEEYRRQVGLVPLSDF